MVSQRELSPSKVFSPPLIPPFLLQLNSFQYLPNWTVLMKVLETFFFSFLFSKQLIGGSSLGGFILFHWPLGGDVCF